MKGSPAKRGTIEGTQGYYKAKNEAENLQEISDGTEQFSPLKYSRKKIVRDIINIFRKPKPKPKIKIKPKKKTNINKNKTKTNKTKTDKTKTDKIKTDIKTDSKVVKVKKAMTTDEAKKFYKNVFLLTTAGGLAYNETERRTLVDQIKTSGEIGNIIDKENKILKYDFVKKGLMEMDGIDLDQMTRENLAERDRLKGIHGEDKTHNELRQLDSDYHKRYLKYNQMFQADSSIFNPENFPDYLKSWE